MPYNIHPIIVHFPIALLTVYCALEIIRIPALVRRAGAFPAKVLLLTVGTIGAAFALLSGDAAQEGYEGTAQLAQVIGWHSTFAYVTTGIFVIITFSYLIRWLQNAGIAGWIPSAILRLEKDIFRSPVLVMLAIVGFGSLLITGALGGSLVYGKSADPLVGPLYQLLNIR